MMADDTDSITLSPSDRDMAIRTVLGESGSDPSAAGVAAVIRNRMQATGQSASSVVLERGQFEPWSTRSRELMSYSPTSPAYQAAAKIVDGVMSGSIPDPTNGATMFYAPAAQAALGRKPPAWDDGTGQQIGAHKFFGGQPVNPFAEYETATTVPGVAPVAKTPSTSLSYADEPSTTSAAPPAPVAPADPFKEYETAGAGPAPAVAQAATPSTPIGINDVVRATATGVPIIGGLLNRADAATNAMLAPVLNPLFSPNNQLQGQTFGERYTNALAQQESMDTNFAKAHPVASTGANIAGSVAGTLPMMAAAPAAFGVGINPAVGILAGAGSGGALGGADAYVRSGFDPNAVEPGVFWGAAGGGLGSAAGSALGYGVGKVANAISGTTPAARNIASALTAAGMTPEEAQGALTRMGPNATLADIDPSLTLKAGALAESGGAPTSILKAAMTARAANASDRISQIMTDQLGPAPDAEATKEAILDAAKTKASPLYEAGRNGPDMDVTPVLASINAQLPNASGGIKGVLNAVKGFLTDDAATKANPVGMTVPKSAPEGILGARQALDDMIYNRDTGEVKLGGNALRVATDLRNQIDEIVKSNPNFAAGDAIYSQAKGVQSAFEQGQDLFKSNMRPIDLARTLAIMTPEESAALRSGSRAAIDDAMKSARRGEGPAAQGLFAKATNNRAVLNMLFPNGQDALDALHGEGVMRATENLVAGGSKTAGVRAAQAEFAPSQGNALSAAPAVIGESLFGGPGAVGLTAGRALLGQIGNALSAGARAKLMEGLARGLSATGAPQEDFLGQVARAYRTNSLTSALSSAGTSGANAITRAAVPYGKRVFITP